MIKLLQLERKKFKEVKKFILCQRCLFIFEKISERLRFYDIECPQCHKIIYLMYAFPNLLEAEEQKEKIQKKRDKLNSSHM